MALLGNICYYGINIIKSVFKMTFPHFISISREVSIHLARAKKSTILSLQSQLGEHSSNYRKAFLQELVKQLNTPGNSNITILDLSWNELNADQITQLLDLEYVTHLDLSFNNLGEIDKSFYDKLGEKFTLFNLNLNSSVSPLAKI